MSQISILLKKLDKEIEEGTHSDGFIDDLQMFIDQREDEEIVGLENKLEKVGRGDEFQSAIDKKERFSKILLRLTHFPSAQMIFAFFLSRIHEVFESHIIHQGNPLSRDKVENLVEEKIIQPTLADMGSDFEHLTLTPTHVRGMIFWLADKCWVRWH